MAGGTRLAPGSGLNCGGDAGGAFELMEIARDQLVTGGRFVGSANLLGSGSKTAGDRGAGPGLMAWWGFRRFGLFVSAAPADTASNRHLVNDLNQDELSGCARNGIHPMKLFSIQLIK